MPTKKWIDKKKADTYNLVFRPRDDPLAYDPEASESVLVKKDNLNSKDSKAQRKQKWNRGPGGSSTVLTEEDAEKFKEEGRRENEGEAALYGITYDDSSYDYMQHLKLMGSDPTAVFIAKKDLDKISQRQKGGDLLIRSSYANGGGSNNLLPEDILPSKEKLHLTYQDQQNVPDEIAGFQPDMDPHLREILEALEDDEYVENDEKGYFEELVASGKAPEYSGDEEDFFLDEEGDDLDGFVSDDEPEAAATATNASIEPPALAAAISKKDGEEEWETAFRQFKIDQESVKKQTEFDGESEEEDQVASLGGFTATTMGRRAQVKQNKKKKKGSAMTELSGFSMSSSAIFRNEGLTLLDDRFDKIEEEYDEDREEEPGAFDMTKERPDLDSIMDDFLDNYTMEGRKMVKKKQ